MTQNTLAKSGKFKYEDTNYWYFKNIQLAELPTLTLSVSQLEMILIPTLQN